jgi:hypothetical protein
MNKLIAIVEPEMNVNKTAISMCRELLLKRPVLIEFHDAAEVEYDYLQYEDYAHMPISNMLDELKRQLRVLSCVDTEGFITIRQTGEG